MSRGLSLYTDISPDGLELHTFLRRLFPSSRWYGDDVAIGMLKRVGEIFKRGGDALADSWMSYVGMETCGGYRPVVPGAIDLDEEARRWVSGPVRHNADMLLSRAERFRLLDRLLQSSRGRIAEFVSPEDFVTDPTRFSTMGSGRGLPRLQVEARYWDQSAGEMVTGPYRFKSSRWTGFLASTPSSLANMLRQPTKQVNRMFVKPDEPAKLRTIVTGDHPTALKMAYLSMYVEPALAGCAYLPMFWSTADQVQRWTRFAEAPLTGREVFMPIDQSGFDENVSLDMILDIVAWLTKVAGDNGGGDDARRIGEALLEALNGGTLMVDGGASFDIERGVLSGWRWTALIDTLANYLQFREITRYVGVFEREVLFQGDDVRLVLDSELDAFKVYLGYKHYGLTVNPSKFWISRSRDEFLRFVSSGGNVRGYLARTITGILYRRPGSAPAPPQEQVLNMTDSWERTVSRGARSEVVRRLQVGELARVFSVTKEIARAFLHTPKAVGGLGLWPPGEQWYVLDQPKSLRSRVLTVGNAQMPMTTPEQLQTVLGLQLPAAPFKVRPYRILPVARVPALKNPFWGPHSHLVLGASYPRPQWDGWNMWQRMWAEERLVAGDQEPPGLRQPGWVWKMRQRLGARAWVDWVKGSLVPSVLSTYNTAMTAAWSATAAGAGFWRLTRSHYEQWRLMVELVVHREIAMQTFFVGQ
jgi:hypothetical protein